MKRKNATRSALFMSVISMLLCVSMLVGTTFAWFTDEVKSGTNVIAAGNLDVELEYAKVVNGEISGWSTVQGADKVFDPNALWEPGRVEVVYLKVSNLGTLNLKYQLGVNVASEIPGTNVKDETFLLSDSLVFKAVEMPDALTTYSDREAVQLAAGTEKGLKGYNGTTTALEPNGVDYVALIVYMPTTVGNEANYRGTRPEINLGVNLFATQVEAESDSFGKDYDEDAWHTDMIVYNAADLKVALANGGNIKLGADIEVTEVDYWVGQYPVAMHATKDAVLNLNGHKLEIDGEKLAIALLVEDGAEVTITGNGRIHCDYLSFAFVCGGSTLNIENGTFTHPNLTGTFIEATPRYSENYKDTPAAVNIYGGTFDCGSGNPRYLLNEVDNCENKSINVYGGSFKNYDPSNGNDGSYLADGYQAVEVDGTYYVVADNVAGVVTNPETLKDALTSAGAAGAGNTTIAFFGNIDMTGVAWTPVKVDGYHGADIVTIEGNGATITGLTAPLFAGGFAGGSGIVIKDLTIADSNIVSTNTLGSGAFIESVDSMSKITLTNCHLVNSTVTGGNGSRTGGLIGWTAGYNNVNDGPVKTYVNITNCSVVGCTITCDGSVGGIYGHAGNNAWTYSTVENCVVKDNVLNSTDDGGWRVGVVVGTANVGELTISNITESGNILTQTGKTAPAGQSNLYGRFVPGTTGKLVIDGATVVTDADQLRKLAANATGSVEIVLADDITLGDDTVQKSMGAYFPNATNVTINGNDNTLTLKGPMTGSSWQAQYYAGIIAPNATVTVKNLTIVNEKLSNKGTQTSADRAAVYTLVRGAEVLFENVNFEGGVQAKSNTKFVDCSFAESVLTVNEAGLATDGRFCVFIDHEYTTDGEYVFTFEGCTFDASGYGCVKVAGDEGAAITVNVKDCSFTNTCPSNKWSATTPKYDIKVTGANITVNDLGGNDWSDGANAGIGNG